MLEAIDKSPEKDASKKANARAKVTSKVEAAMAATDGDAIYNRLRDAAKAVNDSTKIIMDAGGEGRIIGRNFWGIPIKEGLELLKAVTEVMQKTEYRRKF